MSLKRALLLLFAGGFASYGGWLCYVYFGQINNTIALQRCAVSLEARRDRDGGLPVVIECRDYWEGSVRYYRHLQTYVLVSGGRDQQEDVRYDQLIPTSIESRSTCFDSNADTVLVGRKPVQYCLK